MISKELEGITSLRALSLCGVRPCSSVPGNSRLRLKYAYGEGHTKALCGLLSRLVRLAQIHVTFFIGISLLDRVRREVSSEFLPGEDELRPLLR